MKINFASLTRTNFGFPSEWKGKSLDNKDIKISYRYGKTQIFYDGELVNTLSIDAFDIGGYMDDHVLENLLKINGLL